MTAVVRVALREYTTISQRVRGSKPMFSRAIYTLTSTGRFSQVGPTVRLLLRDRSNSLPRTYCTLGLLLRLTALRTYCDVGLTTTATLSSFIVGLPPPILLNQYLAGDVLQVSVHVALKVVDDVTHI